MDESRGLRQRAADYSDRAIQAYDSSALAPILAAVPYVGSAIDRALSIRAEQLWKERISQLFQQMAEQLAGIREDSLSKDFLDSSDFQGMCVRVVRNLETTQGEEKIRLLANLLSGAILNPDYPRDRIERYLRLVEDLTGSHMAVLRLLAERRAAVTNVDGERGAATMTSRELANLLGLEQDETEAYAADLIGRGLVFDPLIGTDNYRRGTLSLHPSAEAFAAFVLHSRNQ